ncbi:MAG: D-alanyl-D-alanine carboxypeptidase [Firmicutes bacterium]|nr:D-alanyl-D-alanine carboxypeptidase [Bacillota bacterium]
MKKRIICGLAVIALAFCGFMGVNQWQPKERSITIVNDNAAALEEKPEFQVAAKSAVLMDADTGKVLFAQEAKTELPPASVTKVMTMLLLMEAEEDGRVKMDDMVTVSENAASMGGSQMYLEPGEKHTAKELLMGIAMVSANDACVAMAEHLCGSVEMFVERMNSRAQELGMKNTNFVNTNGLPAENHYSSAYDIAVMTRELLRHEASRELLTKEQAVIKVGLPGKEKDFELINTNKMLKQYSGAIGVKTGFTQDAMYCLSAAAEREGTCLIAVVLGSESSAVRFGEAKKLLDYGFSNYETITIAEKGETVKKLTLEKSTPQKIRIETGENVCMLVKKGSDHEITSRIEISEKIKVPVRKGEEAGRMVVYSAGVQADTFKLVYAESAEKASFKEIYVRMMKKIG